MDYEKAIENIYEHLENDDFDKAVMACLRIARNLNDYFYTAVFLRELNPVRRDFLRVLIDDTKHLKKEAQEHLDKVSLEYWVDNHQLDFSFSTDEDGEDRNILDMGVGEIKSELQQSECAIEDLIIPPGVGEFDAAAFTDKYNMRKVGIRLRIIGIRTIKERIKTMCLNYAIRIERQLKAQNKTTNILQDCYNEVNNYFYTHSKDVYDKLQKASKIGESGETEDFSLLLTLVRRAIKATADYFYPAKEGSVKCIDGESRYLGDEQYLNRLQEYLWTTFEKSSSRDLIRAEFDYLAVLARRLNAVASKGIHSDVSSQEAKQGIIGLYMLLFNIILKLQWKNS